MKSLRSPSLFRSDALSILGLTVFLLTAYTALLCLTGLRAQLAESNLQANLIRISNYLHAPPAPVAIAGSSVAGRLLPEYFSERGVDVQNLGLDGSRPLFAFEILRMREDLPATLLVDTSALFQPLMSNDDTLRASVKSPTFTASQWVPPLRPSFRPSSILYSQIKNFRDSRDEGVAQPPEADDYVAKPEEGLNKPRWDPLDQFEAVRDSLADFKKRGASVQLLAIPRGRGWGVPMDGLNRRLADELGVGIVDPGPVLAANGTALVFSDGLHLSAKSAQLVSGEISRQLTDR